MKRAERAAQLLEPLRKRFAGQPCLCFAPGPSLPKLWHGRSSPLPKIAVGNAWEYVPDADILYHTDGTWWAHYRPTLPGAALVSYEPVRDMPELIVVEGSGVTGYDPRLGWVRNGNCSGHVAVHLAAQLGANPIVLIGFDCREVKGRRHCHAGHPPKVRKPMPFERWQGNFRVLKAELDKLGIVVLNATPGSALGFFPSVAIEDVLEPMTA